MEDGRLAWALNNISVVHGQTPILHAVKLGVSEETESYVSKDSIPTEYNFSRPLTENGLPIYAIAGTHVIKVRKNEVVDFVLQNTAGVDGPGDIHPWHMHLHNFWVLGYGAPGSPIRSLETRSSCTLGRGQLSESRWTTPEQRFFVSERNSDGLVEDRGNGL